MIRIKSKKDGFRRCGVPFSTQWTEFPNNYFSKAEQEILKSDSMLVVAITQEKAVKAKE